jgi:hypothetical protein
VFDVTKSWSTLPFRIEASRPPIAAPLRQMAVPGYPAGVPGGDDHPTEAPVFGIHSSVTTFTFGSALPIR